MAKRPHQTFGGTVDWEQVLGLLGQRPAAVKALVAAAQKAGTTPSRLNWVGIRLGHEWAHLTGKRVAPYECQIGPDWFMIEGEQNFYDPDGKLLDQNSGSAQSLAVFVVETAPALAKAPTSRADARASKLRKR